MAHRSFQGLLRLFCLRFFCNYPGSYESWAVLGEPMHFRTPIEHPLVINYDGISLAGAGEHRSQQFRPEHVINVPVAHPIAVIPATPVYLYTPIPAWLSPTGYFRQGLVNLTLHRNDRRLPPDRESSQGTRRVFRRQQY